MAAGARTGDTPPVPNPVKPGMGTGSRRVLSFAATIAVGLVLMVLLRALVAQSFFVPTTSMAPTVEPGDRVLVNKLADRAGLHRGDVIVFDGTSTFAAADRSPRSSTGAIGRALGSVATAMGIQLGEQDFLKRIVGLPGDRVVCCDAGGRLSVNGVSVAEHYLLRDAKASDEPFDVLVPPGQLWVMGDNRPVSADSRAHLGDPGGGMVLIDDVIGRASVIYWPLARAGGLPGSGPLRSVPSPTGGGS